MGSIPTAKTKYMKLLSILLTVIAIPFYLAGAFIGIMLSPIIIGLKDAVQYVDGDL